MAVQTDYVDLRAAFEGMIANTEPNILISRTVEDDPVGFGKVVTQGAGDNGVVAAEADNDVVRGITVRDMSVDPASPDAFAVGDSALIMTQGVIWVTAGATVAAGDLVYMVVGTARAGQFTNASTDNLPIPGAIFDSSGDADDLVKVRIGGNVTGPQGEPG